MKKISLLIGLIIVFTNSIIGLLLSSYKAFNWVSSDIIIIFNTLLINFLYRSNISSGFKVSLAFIFPLIGLITFFFSLKLENNLNNNKSLLGILILITFQIIILILANSLKSDKK